MRIYGGHDYYDVGLSMGVDPTIILVREKSRSISVEDAGGTLLDIYPTSRYAIMYGSKVPSGESLVPVAVAFCDKVYRGVLVPDEWRAGKGVTFEGIWSANKLRAWVEKTKIKVEMDGPWKLRERLKFEDYFLPFAVSARMRQYMILNKLSILVERHPNGYRKSEGYFEVNRTGLKHIGFAKAVDPFTAFQELSMWIGGVLGGASPEIVRIVDDKTLLEGHGFDNRISFRGPRVA